MSQNNIQPGRVLVVGAGITGLSAAWMLCRAGFEVTVREGGPEPGGLLAPIDFRGIPCDRGSHRIHPAAHPLLLELTQSADWHQRPRRGKLVLSGRHMAYPLQIGDFLRGLGPKTAAHMAANFLVRPGARRGLKQWEADRADVEEDIGFEAFVTARVGRRAYQQFYAPYVEKVWGMHPSEISQTVAKARVSTASPISTLKKALQPGDGTDASFFYPSGGMAELVDFFTTGLLTAGVDIEYDSPVEAGDLAQWDGPVLYSGHLSHIAPGHGLEHRGLFILHIALPKGSVGDTDTFYLPEARFDFGRVSQPAQFSGELSDPEFDILCAEIPQGRHSIDTDFTMDRERIQSQLVAAGIIGPHVPLHDVVQTFCPRVYPIYARGWLRRWRAALQAATQAGVLPIGRQGLFLHCNIDQCVHIADEAVRHLVSGRTASEWAHVAERFLALRVRD